MIQELHGTSKRVHGPTRVVCTVAAEKVDVADPVKEGIPALIPALSRVIVDYRTHWRLVQSVIRTKTL